MNTYMKKNGAECCYVTLAFDGQQLVLTKPKGFFQERLVEIPVDDISHLTCDEHFGSQRIGFIHHNDYYEFYTCGLSVIDYMKEQLFV